MRHPLLLLAPALLAACSASDDAPSCGVAAGTYAQTEEFDPDRPGSCDNSQGGSRPTTFSVLDHGDGTAEISIERRTQACPATLDGCTLTARCPWQQEGVTVGEIQLSLSFSASGASGTSYYRFAESPVTPLAGCDAHFLVSATRQ